MRVVINNTTYTQVSSLGFSPETDLANNSMPINEFECLLYTNNIISYGSWADLEDDLGQIWAHYWIRYAERIGRDDDKQTYIVKIIVQSPIAFLERVNLPAEFIDNDAYTEIQSVLDYVGDLGQIGDIISDSDIADEFEQVQITGFCPEQTARERLQWLLLVAGGYVQSYFDDVIHIEKTSMSGSTSIPIDKTFWKPSVTFRDYVTLIRVHAYSYVQGTPASGEEYVTDGTTTWIQTETVITLSNSAAPASAPKNEIEIEGVTLISPTTAGQVIANIVGYYFNRVEVDADVINNAEYIPGDRVTVNTEDDQLYTGYIDRCDFSFGLQARSGLHLTGAQNVDGATLTVLYMWGNKQVSKQTYFLPKGYEYTISSQYLDSSIGGHRYIFRPAVASISGTLTTNTTQTINVEVALDWYQRDSVRNKRITEQYNNVRKLMTDIYNKEKKLVKKSLKGDKNKKKREKYLNQISQASATDLKRINQALSTLIKEIPKKEYVLHIKSVDSVDYEDSVVYDPDDRTVVIE